MRALASAIVVATILGHSVKHACAQVVPSAVGPGAYVAVGAGVSGFEAVYGQRDLAGGFLYADVHPQWRVGFEGEARFLRFHTSEDVTETNYVGGIRVRLLHAHALEPYAKFLTGTGKITLPFGKAHGSFLAYVPGAGLDVALNHNVSVRAIDFEYQHWPQFPYGSFSPYGISSGIRVRVTPLARIPQSVRKRVIHQRGTSGDSEAGADQSPD